MSYGQLDVIADASNPMLGFVCLFRCIYLMWMRQWRESFRMLVLFCCVLIIAHGWELIDQRFVLWPRLGLDFSSHTALAVAASGVLWMFWKKARICWVIWLLAYVTLMMWQGYHSAGDIGTTAVVVMLSILPLIWFLHVQRTRPVARMSSISPR